MLRLPDRALLAELSRFGTIGVAVTLLHGAVAWLAHRSLGMPPFAANLAGYGVAVGLSFAGHSLWTFRRRDRAVRRLARFIVVSLAGFALSNATIWVVTRTVDWPFEVALAINLALIPAATWLVSRLWVFASAD